MAFRIQIRRDTSTNWTVNNPILLEGELGYETNTTYLKVGDGTTPWNDLPYWQGGLTGSGLTVKRNSTTIQSPTSNLNFSTDFTVTAGNNYTATIGLNTEYPGTQMTIYEDGVNLLAGATGLNFTNSPGSVTVDGNIANIDLGGSGVPYYSLTILLNGGNPTAISSSRGPDGNPLDGPPWNFTSTFTGTAVTVSHNTGNKVMDLSTFGTNSSNVWVRQPVGTSVGAFSLSSSTNDNSFTVYGINSSNTGASSAGTVEIVWTFGS